MVEWWNPYWDATAFVVVGLLGTWLAIRWGRWEERR